MAGDKEQVAGLDIEVQKPERMVHVIEGFRGLGQVAQQLVAGDALETVLLVELEQLMERPVGQLHDDHELAVGNFNAVQGDDERMADADDELEGLQFLGRLGLESPGGVAVGSDELDSFVNASRGFAFPDVPEATPTQRLSKR